MHGVCSSTTTPVESPDLRNRASRDKDRNMSLPVVDPNLCTACGICADECPNSCYDIEDIARLNRPDDCSECGTCVDACPNGAITMD